MEWLTLRIKPNQKDRIEALKVHERQANHEIIEMLLDTYGKYVRIMDNDMDDGR